MTPCQLPYTLQDTVWGHCSTECIIKDVMSPLCWIELWQLTSLTRPCKDVAMESVLGGSVSTLGSDRTSAWHRETKTNGTHRTAEHRNRTSGYNNSNFLCLVLIITINQWLVITLVIFSYISWRARCASCQWLALRVTSLVTEVVFILCFSVCSCPAWNQKGTSMYYLKQIHDLHLNCLSLTKSNTNRVVLVVT